MPVSTYAVMPLLIFCYTMWGGGMIAMKYAFESFSVVHVIFARVCFAAIVYLMIFPLWRRLPYEKGDWKYLGAMVLFEPVLFFLFETYALKFTTASQAGIIAACFPICTALAAWLFLKEQLNRRMVIAIVFAVLGVASTSYFSEGSQDASHPLLGNLLMLGAVLASAGYAVCVRFIARRYSPLSISAIQAIGGSVIFLPLLLGEPLPQSVSMPALGGLLYMGIGVGLLVYMSFNFALKHIEAGVVALFGNLIPIFTLLFAYLLLDERLNVPQMVGVALTFCGVFIATTGMKKS